MRCWRRRSQPWNDWRPSASCLCAAARSRSRRSAQHLRTLAERRLGQMCQPAFPTCSWTVRKRCPAVAYIVSPTALLSSCCICVDSVRLPYLVEKGKVTGALFVCEKSPCIIYKHVVARLRSASCCTRTMSWRWRRCASACARRARSSSRTRCTSSCTRRKCLSKTRRGLSTAFLAHCSLLRFAEAAVEPQS